MSSPHRRTPYVCEQLGLGGTSSLYDCIYRGYLERPLKAGGRSIWTDEMIERAKRRILGLDPPLPVKKEVA